MIDPAQNILRGQDLFAVRDLRTIDHQNRQRQMTRCNNLGFRSGTARILGHDKIDPVLLHQIRVAGSRKRPAINDNAAIRQGNIAGLIDQAQQVMVLRLSTKGRQMHSPQSQHHTFRRLIECRYRALDVSDPVPSIARLGLPGWPGQRRNRYAGLSAGGNRISAHARSKRMRGIDHMRNVLRPQKRDQTHHAPVSADTRRNRLRSRVVHPSGIGKNRIQTGLGNRTGQRTGLGRSPQYQKARFDG